MTHLIFNNKDKMTITMDELKNKDQLNRTDNYMIHNVQVMEDRNNRLGKAYCYKGKKEIVEQNGEYYRVD
jgi:hypothetical protein